MYQAGEQQKGVNTSKISRRINDYAATCSEPFSLFTNVNKGWAIPTIY